jgi:NAD-dependent dihydropyrimidine dehydrogenase PreA subunit
MLFKNASVDGLNIFYREAGDETAPKLVLLHGFPASSHQYRNLIPALTDRFHGCAGLSGFRQLRHARSGEVRIHLRQDFGDYRDLVIHPDECIDCGVCEPECPVDAIKPDTEPGLRNGCR